MVSYPISVCLDSVSVKRRGKNVLGPLSLDLKVDGVTVVLGPNGAGKTTFLKVLHGVERVSYGTVNWSIPDTKARQSQAYVFQSPIMLRRSVRQNLAYPLQLIGMDKVGITTRILEWAQKIGLQDVLDFPAPRLSGGEQQKLALGRALIRTPQVLFLDEPCANLDGGSTREIEELLKNATKAGTHIIMTTHDLGQARRLAGRVLFFLKGTLHEQGNASEFFRTPGTSAASAFLNGDIIE